MNVSIEQHRALVGVFNLNKGISTPKNRFSLLCMALFEAMNSVISFFFKILLFLQITYNSIIVNCVFKDHDVIIFPVLGLGSWILGVTNVMNQTSLTIDFLLTLCLTDSIMLGNTTLLIWIKSFCQNFNLSIWRFFILYYSYTNSIYLHINMDVEKNPGPKDDFLKIMHWNPNSLSTLDFFRISLIQAYNAVHNFHIISISESALTSDITNDQIDLPGYTPLRNDLEGSNTHGGVLIWHKIGLAVKNRADIFDHSNTLVLELSISRKRIFYILCYRKFNQTNDEMNSFFEKLDCALQKIKAENPYCIMMGGDFNAHLKDWYTDGITDTAGVNLLRVLDDYGLTQLVDQPTYIVNNTHTCVDLFATDQPGLVLSNEVHPSLHPNCHHQINYTKLSFELSTSPSL